ncbi:MAG TPA: 23S rRNA (guanosine(2251)-2'-O)-methyltransferase RlmB [Pseudogracilibacillus sp.]|nr:23S rRNA (guanosine(2251)-2'-O)-methyltransferase RlmB [Pseudogracilibacillus sp.]
MREEMIIGKNPVLEAIRSGRTIHKILLSDAINKRVEQDMMKQAKKNKVIVQKVPRKRLDQLTDGSHQGVLAYVSNYSYFTIDDILQNAANRQEIPFIMILDELEDPHNLGAILRTADAAGAHGIIIPKRRSALLTQTVAKASAGAIEHIPVARVTNIGRAIDYLKEKHIWVVGTDETGEKDYRTLDGQTAIALVIGNEGNGMTRLVKEKCDWLIQLPMQGNIPSLNASVAASLLMYEIFRKRNPLGEN